MKLLLCLMFLPVLPLVMGANILMAVTLGSKSITNMFLPIAQELASRGHTITFVSLYPLRKQTPGIKEVLLPEIGAIFDQLSSVYMPGKDPEPIYQLSTLPSMKSLTEYICHTIIDNPGVQDILQGKEKFDLAIVNLFSEDCVLGITKKLNIPFVYLSSYGLPPENTHNLRIPSCMPYCPLFVMEEYSNKMSFVERMKNSFTTLFVTWIREQYLAPTTDKVLQQRLGPDLPSVLDIERNVSLIVLNDHFSMTYARPILPNVIQAACMHCKPAGPLPKDIEDWVEGSGDEGFVYFSLGTVVPIHLMPRHLLAAFTGVFSKLKQRVIWKTDSESIENLPPNVKLFKWLPQQDLLGHPKIRAFITHGGLLSVQESAYHGVPMLGMPSNIDQPYNMRAVEQAGTGIYLPWKNVNNKTLEYAVKQLLTDQRYKENVAKKKSMTRDLMNFPLDTVMFWIEYVIRHDGAPQLRTGGIDLPWYQYHQLDLLLVLLLFLFAALLLIVSVCRALVNLLLKKKKNREKQE